MYRDRGHFNQIVLEDLAGNSIERPFEVDLTNKADVKRAATATAGTVYREFTIVP